MRCALSTLVGYELISILFICLETRALGEKLCFLRRVEGAGISYFSD